MKIRPVRTELFHADGHTDRHTDMTKLIVTFRSFASAPKKDTTSNNDILHAGCLERCTISGMKRNKHIQYDKNKQSVSIQTKIYSRLLHWYISL